MASYEITRAGDRRAVVLFVEGVVDAEGGESLARLLREIRAPQVIIDFTRAVRLHDVILGVLARHLTREPQRLRVRGLGDHHVRLLSYFGLTLDDGGAIAPAPPEGGSDVR